MKRLSSDLEEKFMIAWDKYMPNRERPQIQYRFHPHKSYRADFAFVKAKLIVEVQGRGRHQSFYGYTSDCLRMIEAGIEGWQMIYIDTNLLKDPESCVRMVAKVLDRRMNDLCVSGNEYNKAWRIDENETTSQ